MSKEFTVKNIGIVKRRRKDGKSEIDIDVIDSEKKLLQYIANLNREIQLLNNHIAHKEELNEELKEQVKVYKKEVHNLNEALKKQQKDNSDAKSLREANEYLEKALNHNGYNIKMLSMEIDKRDTEIKALKEMLKETNSRCRECSLFKNSNFYKGE